jgi:hypothetical protein
MKRILSIAFAAALLGQAVVAFAQDSGEPSERSVLDAARAKYRASQGADAEAESRPAPESPEASAAPAAPNDDFPYTPVQLSFVPGVSLPFGQYDVTLSAAMIGGLTRDVAGAAGAGVFNISRDLRGAQGAGVFNIARNLRGAQGAGVFNILDEEARGAQGAGVFNIAKGLRGAQGAGVFNMAEGVEGFQGAGLFNIAGDVRGGQAAGLFNIAGDVKGVQIGIVNFAKNVDGAQIGLINFAGNGIESLALAIEPATSYAYAYWQAGTPSFYTIAAVGAPCRDWEWDFAGAVASYGFGSRSSFLGMYVDADVSAASAIGALPYRSFDWDGDWGDWKGWSSLRPYPSLRVEAGMPVGHHWKVFAGVKADVDVDRLGDRVPEALKKGGSWKGRLFDEGFTVWPKWFFGLKM